MCFAACLASFLWDRGVHVSQSDIVQSHPTLFNLGDSDKAGSLLLTLDNIGILNQTVGERYNFLATPIGDVTLDPNPEAYLLDLSILLRSGETYLLATRNLLGEGEHHVVRWHGEFCEGRLIVMDPVCHREGIYGLWSIQAVVDAKCSIISLRKTEQTDQPVQEEDSSNNSRSHETDRQKAEREGFLKNLIRHRNYEDLILFINESFSPQERAALVAQVRTGLPDKPDEAHI